MFLSLLLGATAANAQVAHVAMESNLADPGLLDGVMLEARLPYVGRFGLAVQGSARINPKGWDTSDEDAWLRESQMGSLIDGKAMAVGSDVWSARLLTDLRIQAGPVGVDLKAGWAIRGQSTGLLVSEQGAGGWWLEDDATNGEQSTLVLNPTVGLSADLPVSGRWAVTASLHQYFPLDDALHGPFPGVTLLALGFQLRVGPSGEEDGVGGQPKADPSKSKSGKPTAAKDEPAEIAEVGIAEVDAVFTEVQGIRNALADLQTSLEDAKTDVERLAASANVEGVQALLDGLQSGDLNLDVKVTMVGGTPKVTPKPGLQGESAELAAALDRLGTVATDVAAQVPDLMKRAEALAAKAQALVEAVPGLAKDTGLSPMQLPKVLKAVKTNAQITGGLPDEIRQVAASAVEVVAILTATATGGTR